MPRPYPLPPGHHIDPHVAMILLIAASATLLSPSPATAGDRDGYGRPPYTYEGRSYVGERPYLDDGYHARYDRYSHRSSRAYYGYSRSYERDYNGRDYTCGCRYGGTAYYRTYNWKGEHEYRQAGRRHYAYDDRDAYYEGD